MDRQSWLADRRRLTCEEVTDEGTDELHAAAQAEGLPVVRGERTDPESGGYHDYPGRSLARAWLSLRSAVVASRRAPVR